MNLPTPSISQILSLRVRTINCSSQLSMTSQNVICITPLCHDPSLHLTKAESSITSFRCTSMSLITPNFLLHFLSARRYHLIRHGLVESERNRRRVSTSDNVYFLVILAAVGYVVKAAASVNSMSRSYCINSLLCLCERFV